MCYWYYLQLSEPKHTKMISSYLNTAASLDMQTAPLESQVAAVNISSPQHFEKFLF